MWYLYLHDKQICNVDSFPAAALSLFVTDFPQFVVRKVES